MCRASTNFITLIICCSSTTNSPAILWCQSYRIISQIWTSGSALTTVFFFFNRHCNPCGFWPGQLSLSILSRKVFTECRCQRHVKPPPNLEDQWLGSSNCRHQVSPTSETTRANPSSGRWNYGRETAEEFCRKWRLPLHFWVGKNTVPGKYKYFIFFILWYKWLPLCVKLLIALR